MTDEEKESDIYDICVEKKSIYCNRKMGEETCSKCKTYKMYKLGLAEGKPKWHDLRKTPNDLPTKSDEYYCHVYEQGYEIHRFNISENCFLGVFSRVIAWTELPKFEEK